ncbi:glycosyltransferase family 2 protein [Lachnospiraceae bacterium]|jgi:glycosyltransferase involved in cell wall biosynthesis|nr:glycosyltransferase family 2 protein [Lachnospiraceae bacterium]
MVSFIISIDTSFAMSNNFFSLFLSEDFVKESEIVVILDGISNIKLVHYIEELENENNNIRLIKSEKVGYGRANNIAVKHSLGEYLFFINCDVFVENGCFEKMFDALKNGKADCVQPLLIYPQSNLVQCAGAFFGSYYKDHLFDGNKIDAPIVQQEGKRQALTSALYAMKKSTFWEFGGFDEFYYNKLEGFELSYKISLSGKTCLYLPSARAWHSRGGGRKQYSFDFRQQEAYFWSRFGDTVKEDFSFYINMQMSNINYTQPYYTIILNQLRTWKDVLSKTHLQIQELIEMPWISPGTFNLWDIFPNELLTYNGNLLLIVENIRYLKDNLYWFSLRNNPYDLAIDRYANAVNIMDYIS